MQHSLGGQDTYYFGFGFVDIGYMEKEINMDTDVENTKVNFFTVFKSYSQGIDMLDFIKTKLCMGPVIGINKSDLSNLKGDSKYIYEKP